mgnify:CR=1 FL=1
MTADELLQRVRKIEIKARRLSRNIFAGEYHSQFKGRGMAFSEVREYQPGDDVRSIDWNVTARLNKPYVKVFEEERELTVMLLVDVSGSRHFGTLSQMKRDMMAEVAATLAFSTIANNDKVGVIFFSDKIEKFISPKKGSTHILRIIRELIDFKPDNTKTDITEALRYLTNVIKKKSTAFILSDFYDTGYEDALKIASKKHDIVSIRITDDREKELPDLGMVKIYDPETQQTLWVDTSSEEVRNNFADAYNQHSNYVSEVFRKYGIDNVEISTGQDYVKQLMRLFIS